MHGNPSVRRHINTPMKIVIRLKGSDVDAADAAVVVADRPWSSSI